MTVFVFYFSPNPEQSCFPKTYQFDNSEVLLCFTCEKALQNLTCVRKFEQCFLRTNLSLKKATGKTWVKYLVAPMFEEGLYSFQVANWSFWTLDLRSISIFVKILRRPFFLENLKPAFSWKPLLSVFQCRSFIFSFYSHTGFFVVRGVFLSDPQKYSKVAILQPPMFVFLIVVEQNFFWDTSCEIWFRKKVLGQQGCVLGENTSKKYLWVPTK